MVLTYPGFDMSGLQRFKSRCDPTRQKPRRRMGRARDPCQHPFPGLHRNPNGGGAIRTVSGEKRRMAETEHAREVEQARGLPRGSGLLDVSGERYDDSL